EVCLRTVVVDAEAAAHVEVFERRTLPGHLDVESTRLAQRVLHVADVGNLAAEVEVEQLEAVEQPRLAHEADRIHQLRAGEPEFRAIAARGLPPASAAGGELHPNPNPRLDAGGPSHFADQRQLGRL